MSLNGSVLSPAYGRDYKSAAACEADFRAEKDFILNDVRSRWNGKPCSIRDGVKGDRIELRYNKMRGVRIITL
jgi:hypothetical protein